MSGVQRSERQGTERAEQQQRVELTIRGVVQGVGYRAFACAVARERGLRGWVRNNPDGTVTAVAEGPRDDLLAFIEACRRGPRSAEVTGIDVKWGPATGLGEGFVIR